MPTANTDSTDDPLKTIEVTGVRVREAAAQCLRRYGVRWRSAFPAALAALGIPSPSAAEIRAELLCGDVAGAAS